MNFTILTPNDTPVPYGVSDATHSNFGGQRQRLHISVGDDADYTVRQGENPNSDQNPIDTAVKDIDEMANTFEHKNRFTQEEIRADVQLGNEQRGIQSDPENRPRMDEGTDGVQVPANIMVPVWHEPTTISGVTTPGFWRDEVVKKQLKKTNRWVFAKTEHYEGEIS